MKVFIFRAGVEPGAKQKNLTPENEARGCVGDIWLWSAVDADTNLVPSRVLGDRNAPTARAFLVDLASRLSNRVQLTSDSHGAYLRAVEGAFGHEIACDACNAAGVTDRLWEVSDLSRSDRS